MPERFTPEVVEQQRARRLVFACQYQQRPAPIEGNLIKRSEVRYYGGIDPRTGQPDEKLPDTFDRKIVSVDCAFKDLATSDYVAVVVIGVKGRKRFLLNVVNQNLDRPATEAEIRRQRAAHRWDNAVPAEERPTAQAVVHRMR